MGRTNPKALKESREERSLESNAVSGNPYADYHKRIRKVFKPSEKMTYGITWVKDRNPVFVVQSSWSTRLLVQSSTRPLDLNCHGK
jgi:hypothetical protein